MGKKTASYFTPKFVQFFKRAAKTSDFTIGRPNVEEFSADDWIYIINGSVSYRIAPDLYELIQPASMVARPAPGEVVNLGNKILDIETILKVWESNASVCTYPAVMTPFSFRGKSGTTHDIFSIAGPASIEPAIVDRKFIEQLGAPEAVDWFGYSSLGPVLGKFYGGFVECLIMTTRSSPVQGNETFREIAERYRPNTGNTEGKKEA